MEIRLDPNSPPQLMDAEVFTSLKISVPEDRQSIADLTAMLGDSGSVHEDAQHVWLDPKWLALSGKPSEEWQNGLAAMLKYAARSGWVDENGRVRAHVVPRGVSD